MSNEDEQQTPEDGPLALPQFEDGKRVYMPVFYIDGKLTTIEGQKAMVSGNNAHEIAKRAYRGCRQMQLRENINKAEAALAFALKQYTDFFTT